MMLLDDAKHLQSIVLMVCPDGELCVSQTQGKRSSFRMPCNFCNLEKPALDCPQMTSGDLKTLYLSHTEFLHCRMRGHGQTMTQTTGQWCRLQSTRACQ